MWLNCIGLRCQSIVSGLDDMCRVKGKRNVLEDLDVKAFLQCK